MRASLDAAAPLGPQHSLQAGAEGSPEEGPQRTIASIEVRCFSSFAAAAYLREAVNALNEAASRPDPFSSFEFLAHFAHHDRQGPDAGDAELWFLAAFDAESLVGYVALKRVTKRVLGWPCRSLRLLVTHDTDRPHLVARTEHLDVVGRAIFTYLLSRQREWSLLELYQQDAGSGLDPPRAGLDLGGYRVCEWPCMENCTIPIAFPSFAGYVEALAGKFRANLRRQMRQLVAAGRLEWLGSSDPKATPALLELYQAVESRSWKSAAEVHVARSAERLAYFEGLLEAHQPMRISIQILLLDGRPIAGLVCGAFREGLYALQLAYDARLQRLAPGSAMLLLGVRQAIEGHFRFLNLLSGFGYYKVQWQAVVSPTRIAQIYRVGSVLYWRRLLGDALRRVSPGRRLVRQARHNPLRRALVDGRPGAQTQERRANDPAFEPDSHGAHGSDATEAALIEGLRRGSCDVLAGAELARRLALDRVDRAF